MSQTPPDSKHAQFLRLAYETALARFPLLQSLAFSDNSNSSPAALPVLVGLLATILDSAVRPCCVVLPDCTDLAIVTSTLVALTKFQAEFPDILRAYASASFKPGHDLVLVQPCGLVYRYEGFFTPSLFRLKVLDRNDSRSLPVSEIACLEKTTRKRPKGDLKSDLRQSQPTVLGSIVGFAGHVNRNFLRNRVLVLGSKKEFLESLARWTIQARVSEDRTVTGTLKNEIPFGVVEDGKVHFLDGYVAAGEPLIAIVSRPEDLATRCSNADSLGRLRGFVLVNDIERLARDWRAYDTITESQRTLLLANESQYETIRIVQQRGCEVWRFTSEEILAGVTTEEIDVPFRRLLKKAVVARDLVISQVPCAEENLDQAGLDFIAAAYAVARNTENGTIQELFQSLFSLLTYCAEYLWPDPAFVTALDARFKLADQRFIRARVWLPSETSRQIRKALDNIAITLKAFSSSGLSPKAKVLLSTLNLEDWLNRESAIVGTPRSMSSVLLEEWLSHNGIKKSVHLINQMSEEIKFDRVIIVAWPGADRFDRLVHQYTSPDLRLLAYRFEQKWLSQYQQRYKRSAISGIAIRRKSELLSLPLIDQQNEEDTIQPPATSMAFDLPDEQFLRRRKSVSEEGLPDDQDTLVDANYVDFTGATFAYLTEGHKLPVVNSYLLGSQAVPGKIPLRATDDLKVGDYVMFRETGDSDIIRFIAEDDIGKLAYQQLRSRATSWRKALQKLGNDPKLVWERLRKFGFARSVQTVRGWLFDQSRICPEDIEDIRKIAQAAHDEELLRNLSELENAKDELISLHIRAGYHLTELLLKELPTKIDVIGQRETLLDLGVGKVRIVHIDEIDPSTSPQRRSQVNRVLWDLKGV